MKATSLKKTNVIIDYQRGVCLQKWLRMVFETMPAPTSDERRIEVVANLQHRTVAQKRFLNRKVRFSPSCRDSALTRNVH